MVVVAMLVVEWCRCDMCSVGVDVAVLVVYIRSDSGGGTMIRLLVEMLYISTMYTMLYIYVYKDI